jgi:hypothetical protein
LLIAVLFFIAAGVLSAADLSINAEDLRLEPVFESVTSASGGTVFSTVSGFHLYIRKKPDMLSVLLTETTKDPEGIEDNYAYRSPEWNAVNGDEIRYLNGEQLTTEWARYSLIDSTPEADAQFGQAFHVYIPRVMVYGYPWSRNGEVTIDRGVFINIRAFGSLHADYTNGFEDNPFMFDFSVVQRPAETPPVPGAEEPTTPPAEEPVLTDAYSDKAVEAFTGIADLGGGELTFSKGPDDIIESISGSLASIPRGQFVDVVFAVDATGSMKDDIDKLRREWLPRLVDSLSVFPDVRIGLLLYRDYEDIWRYRDLPVKIFSFTKDLDRFFLDLGSFNILGTEGGDVPEAVFEALWAAIDCYPWNPEAEKKIILIGDAEPHPKPRGSGKYTKELVEQTSRERGIRIDTIILPDDKSKRKK